jgi:hypothetical protein
MNTHREVPHLITVVADPMRRTLRRLITPARALIANP